MLRNYDIKPLVQNTVMLRRPGPKKRVVLFPEIGRVNFFYHSPVGMVECVSEYMYF